MSTDTNPKLSSKNKSKSIAIKDRKFRVALRNQHKKLLDGFAYVINSLMALSGLCEEEQLDNLLGSLTYHFTTISSSMLEMENLFQQAPGELPCLQTAICEQQQLMALCWVITEQIEVLIDQFKEALEKAKTTQAVSNQASDLTA